MINFSYSRPSTTKSAIDFLMKDDKGQFIAGGTNLVDLMKRGVMTPERLIDINSLPFRTIENKNETLYIGALTSNADVAANDTVRQYYPLLAMALEAGASPQLRNMATIGGNMLQRTRCSYFYDTAMPCNKREPGTGCSALKGYNRMHAIFGTSENCIAVHPSDMCVALAALDTKVIVQSANGIKKIAFASLHRLPGTTPQKDTNLEKGDLITGIEISKPAFGQNVHYLKVRDRSSYAFALVSVAAALELSGSTLKDVRIAMGGVAHKPWRMTAAENFLKGKSISFGAFHEAATIAMKEARGFGHNDFKLKLAPRAIEEALMVAGMGTNNNH